MQIKGCIPIPKPKESAQPRKIIASIRPITKGFNNED